MISASEKEQFKKEIGNWLKRHKINGRWGSYVYSCDSLNAFEFGFNRSEINTVFIDYDAFKLDKFNNRPFLDIIEYIEREYPEFLREKEINDYFEEMINEG